MYRMYGMPQADSQKNFHHRGHGGHREKPIIVKRAYGVVNNLNLCALCGESF